MVVALIVVAGGAFAALALMGDSDNDSPSATSTSATSTTETTTTRETDDTTTTETTTTTGSTSGTVEYEVTGSAMLILYSDRDGEKTESDPRTPVSYTHLTLPTKRIV